MRVGKERNQLLGFDVCKEIRSSLSPTEIERLARATFGSKRPFLIPPAISKIKIDPY